MCLRTLQALANLAEDAVEAVIHWFNFDRAADELWERTKAEAAERADRLAEAEAEEEVSEPQCACCDPTDARKLWKYIELRTAKDLLQSSVVAPQVTADSATTERPPAPSTTDQDVAAGGLPNEKLMAAAAYGLREYADSRYCGAPTYWRSIAAQLNWRSIAELDAK